MKIAQIVPVWGIYDPEKATGINLVAREVTRGLIRHGHKVTVIAPIGSIKEEGLNLIETIEPLTKNHISLFDEESAAYSLIHASMAASSSESFDIIHNHMEHLFLPFVRLIKVPVVTTIHGVNFPSTAKVLFQQYTDYSYVSISQMSKKVLPYINFSATVYNGLQVEKYKLSSQKGKYLLFLGRLVPEKGAHIAIEVAKQSGRPLVIAGQKEAGKESYFEEIQKKAKSLKVKLLSWLDFPAKVKLLQEASAVLFPISWEEPFGLVMAEAMVCGTPVIAFDKGSVPEVVKDGTTGFIIDFDASEKPGRGTWVIKEPGIKGMVEAVDRIDEIDRATCRKHVEDNFTVEKMVEGYEKVYKKILGI